MVEVVELKRIITVIRQNLYNTDDEIVEIVLHDLNSGKPPSTNEILYKVCIYHNLLPENVQKKERYEKLIRIRQQYYFFAYLFGYSLHKIGFEVNRSHATVHLSKNKAIDFYRLYPKYHNEINEILLKFPDHKDELEKKIKLLYNE